MLAKSMPLRVTDPSLKDLVKYTRKILTPYFPEEFEDVPDLKTLAGRTQNLEVCLKSFNNRLSSHLDDVAKSNLTESQHIMRLSTHREIGKEDQMRTLEHMSDSYTKQIDFYNEEIKKINLTTSKLLSESVDFSISKDIDEIKSKIKSHSKNISQQKRQLSSFWNEQERHFAESKCNHNEALFRLKYFEIKNEELSNRLARIDELKISLQSEKEKLSGRICEIKTETNITALNSQVKLDEKHESVMQLLNKTQKDIELIVKKYSKILEAAEAEKENMTKEANVLRRNIEELGKVVIEQQKQCLQEEKRSSVVAESLGSSIVRTELRDSVVSEKRRTSKMPSKLRNSVEEGKKIIKNTDKLPEAHSGEDFDQPKLNLTKEKSNPSVSKHPDMDNLKSFKINTSGPKLEETEDSKLPSIFSDKKSEKHEVSQEEKPVDEFGFD